MIISGADPAHLQLYRFDAASRRESAALVGADEAVHPEYVGFDLLQELP